MLFILHVYSSWYLRHVVAIVLAVSPPKCEANLSAIDWVLNNVPYTSKASTMLFDILVFMVFMFKELERAA